MAKEVSLSEKTYDQLLDLNKGHGGLLFCDTFVAERYLPAQQVKVPRLLPKSVLPKIKNEESLVGRIVPIDDLGIRRQEVVEGVEAVDHGKRVWYERVFGDENRLIMVKRHCAYDNPYGDRLGKVNSHYHVSSELHAVPDFGLGSPVMGLGDSIPGFDGVFRALNRQLLLYAGEIFDHRNAYTGALPPADLAYEMLREFAMGFREKAESFRHDDSLLRINNFLDRIP